jgi:hypothetical protein
MKIFRGILVGLVLGGIIGLFIFPVKEPFSIITMLFLSCLLWINRGEDV